MTCDRAEDRMLLLSRGLFGAPTGAPNREREARAEERAGSAPEAPGRDG